MKPFIVGAVGVEPTCNQLPFLHGISVRGYTPKIWGGLKGTMFMALTHLVLPQSHYIFVV